MGKVKTGCQMAAILLLLYHGVLFGLLDTDYIGTALIYVAAALTLWSMVYYLKMAMPYLFGDQE